MQEDLHETTPAVNALCSLLLSDKLAELQQHVPRIIQVCSSMLEAMEYIY